MKQILVKDCSRCPEQCGCTVIASPENRNGYPNVPKGCPLPDAPADTVPRELFDRACELVMRGYGLSCDVCPSANTICPNCSIWKNSHMNKELAALRSQADGRNERHEH